jgi:2-methylcitrate dehydratase PrpD
VTGATADVIRLSRAAAMAIPPATITMARLCVLDWFGLAIAGAREPVSLLLREAVLAEGAKPAATALGHGRMFSLRQAALLNGTAGHALDYDDVNLAMHVHPTTVILPPLLALAEARGLGGQALIAAFVAGYEAAGMIGAWLGSAPYDRGFHMTGTVGCIGAAAGCAHLLGLDEETTARAYGLAATQAAGLKAQFGTMAKPLHAGRAAEAGLTAALWAAAGMSSRTDILEAAQGYAATQATIPSRPICWSSYELDRNLFKYHAACFGTHGAIEAIGSLRADGLRAEDVGAIRIRVDAGADRMCNIAEPRTGTEAKFSLRFAAALALAGCYTADPATFRDDLTSRPDLVALRDRVVVELAPAGWPDEVTEVDVLLTDGRPLSARRDMSLPSADASRLRAKFDALTRDCLPAARAETIAAMIGQLEGIDDISVLCRAATG